MDERRNVKESGKLPLRCAVTVRVFLFSSGGPAKEGGPEADHMLSDKEKGVYYGNRIQRRIDGADRRAQTDVYRYE